MYQTDELATRLARMSDRICSRILYESIDWIDVQIESEKMRNLVQSEMPDKLYLFDALYEKRFRRIWEQWHQDFPNDLF